MGEAVIVALGSTRRPKLEAVRAAVEDLRSHLRARGAIEVIGVNVPSGVRHTPQRRAELMAGARIRAEALAEQAQRGKLPWNFFVGLEGGFEVVRHVGRRVVLLENWAYVSDGRRGFFGSGGSVSIPEAIALAVLEQGKELAEAIDAFTGRSGVRDQEGTWGVLTHGLITRQDAFRLAVINAFVPFVNRKAYRL